MENQVNAVPTTLQPSQKSRKRIWPWMLLGLAGIGFGLCVCLLIPLIAILMEPTWLNLFKTGAPQVNISVGSYAETTYTAPGDHFSCDFKGIMYQGLNPVLRASENIEQGTGTVFASNDWGAQYGVDYFNISLWGGNDLLEALSDPETLQQSLQTMLDEILLPARGPQAVVTHQEFVQSDLLFAVISDPESSMLVQESNGVTKTLDYQEGYYIFARQEWFYFAYHYLTPLNDSQGVSPAVMQDQVDTFFTGCQFQP